MTMCSSLCVLRLVSLEGARPLGVRALGVQAAKNIGTPSKNKKNPPGRPSRGTSYAQIKKLADSKASRGMIREIVIRPGLKEKTFPGASDGEVRVAEDFSQLRLRDDMVAGLKENKIHKPTIIQTLAIPRILRGLNVLCAAETGSGKTLAYLIPLMNRLKDDEERHGMMTRLGRPRALVVLPSRELAYQTLLVAKSLCHTTKIGVMGLIKGRKTSYIKDGLEKPVDLMIATPSTLFQHLRKKKVLLTDLSHIVIDEADVMFDKSFSEFMTKLFESFTIRKTRPPTPTALGEGAQVTLVGATLSDRLVKDISKKIPSIKKISSKMLHRLIPHVEQRFIKVLPEDRGEKLVSILNDSQTRPTMVFCNTVPTCDWVGYYLQEKGFDIVKLHSSLDPFLRGEKLLKFIEGKKYNILVCTDMASRGIDTTNVTQVIMFDFPHGLTEYVHRAGRTGRVGCKGRCRVISLIHKRSDIKTAWIIKESADKREAIFNRHAANTLNSKQQ